MTNITVASIQCAFSDVIAENLDKTEALIAQAAKGGAQVVLPAELLQGYYFSPPVSADLVADMLRQQHRLHWQPAQNTPKGGFWRKEASSGARLMPLAEPVLTG